MLKCTIGVDLVDSGHKTIFSDTCVEQRYNGRVYISIRVDYTSRKEKFTLRHMRYKFRNLIEQNVTTVVDC